MRPVYGVLAATIIDNKDPNGYGRVKIKLPYEGIQMEYWAPVAVLLAGDSRGTYFIPEVGDQVLVSFLDGDISRPFVVGSLWNNAQKPPDTGDSENNIKMIRSKSGHTIKIDDTDSAEKIEIVDKSGKNSIIIETASNKISIKSDGDINIEAPKGTLKLSAQDIQIEASAKAALKGDSGVDIESSSSTNIKGSIINLN